MKIQKHLEYVAERWQLVIRLGPAWDRWRYWSITLAFLNIPVLPPRGTGEALSPKQYKGFMWEKSFKHPRAKVADWFYFCGRLMDYP